MKKVFPKKHLGQHFLKDENIAAKIVRSLTISGHDLLIEVGPGTGILTKHLIDRENFVSYDVDAESIAFLGSMYPNKASKFLNKDFLDADLTGSDNQIAIIGNFPYNISSQIFFKVFDNRSRISQVVCMIQKEVADRIVSREGSKVYGILSVLLQAFYHVEYLFTVKPGVFDPPPKVTSSVIRLSRNEVKQLNYDDKYLKRVVKTAFGKRRKTLRNALKELNLPADFLRADIFSKRAEQLSVSEFIDLTESISKVWKP